MFNLTRLESLTGNDPLLKQEIAVLFKETVKRSRAAMDANLDEHEHHEWGNAVHELKGAADNLGFTPIADACRLAEADMKSGKLDKKAKLAHAEAIDTLSGEIFALLGLLQP